MTFKKYYKQYRDKIFTHFMYRVRNQALAEDLTSTTFLKALEGFVRYDDSGSFSTWIYTIAKNVLIDHYRKQQRVYSVVFTEEHADHTVDTTIDLEMKIDQIILYEHMIEALEELSEKLQICMTYFYIDQLTVNEISEITGNTAVTIRQQLSRGRKQTREFLRKTYHYTLLNI